MTNALEVDHLAVRFGAVEVFRDVSFAVLRGTTLAIIGPNGAGKTVLFKALIGSIPYEGSIRWAPGTKIGYVPQKLDIERDLPITAQDFLRAKAAVLRASQREIAEALALVGLGAPTLKVSIGALSGGQFQRLLVAFALIGSPDVMLLDEPAAGIDGPGQGHLNDTIQRLQQEKGVTVILISHDLTAVYRYATNVMCMSRGQVSFGPPRTVLTPAMLSELYGAEIGFHVHDEH